MARRKAAARGERSSHRASVQSRVPVQSGAGAATLGAATLGAAGESVAEAHLVALGLRIRGRNEHAPGWELDLIAEVPPDARPIEGEAGTLVFCEVKTRSYRRDAAPMLEAVPRSKRRRLARAALAYCQRHRLDPPIRFDVIAVGPDPRGGLRVVEHLRHAFTCEDLGVG